MSRCPSDKATRVVAIDDTGAVWYERSSPDVIHHVLLKPFASDQTALATELNRVLVGKTPTHCVAAWVFGHASMPCWLQVTPQGTRSLRELQAVARGNARQWWGANDANPAMLVHADWSANQPFICEALPAIWQGLLGSKPCVSSPLRLGLARLTRRSLLPGWYAVTTPHEAHLLARGKDQWLHLRSLSLRGDSDTTVVAEQMHHEWQRERLRIAGPEGPLNWLHLGHTSTAWNATDFCWFDASLQQWINTLPAPTNGPDMLTRASYQLWALLHLGTIGAGAWL